MQFIQPKRSKYKKCTKNYVQDNLLDIIDIEETLLKNRYISKVQKSDFIYSKFLPKYESLSLKPLSQTKPLILKSLSKEKLLLVKDPKSPSHKNINNNNVNHNNNLNNINNNNNNNNDNNNNTNEQKKILSLISENINYEVLNKNKFDINFKKLKLEYKNGYRVLFTQEYFPIEIIGAGAFGLVVNVIQIKTGQKMAVKIINKNNVNYNNDPDYLNNEVHILNSLDNPRIMKIYDILDNHHYYFIFMELIEGGNLKDLIIKRYLDNNIYLFRDSECAQIMKGILEALNYLHKKNIIHRDIKPENILFKNKDDLSSVILCDFGLAYQLNEYENSISGSCGTTIYMAPEILLKKNYDSLVDSFSAGIVLYILCSGGMHPFYKKGTSQKDYIDKLIQQKCLCKFSNEMPLLARNLFLKLCKFEPIFRYEVYKALNHPWITRSTKSQIPMTILEEYNKSDKIKTFHALLSSVVSLAILKKYFHIKKKKKEEFCKNNSYYENLEKTCVKNNNIHQILNMQDKYMLLTSMKKNSKNLFGDSTDEKRISPKKLGSVNTTLFNIKSTKNANKRIEPPILSKPNYFLKTGILSNKNNNNENNNLNNINQNNNNQNNNNNNFNNKELRSGLRTNSFKENDKQKEQQKNISKSKTHSKYKQIKSSSGHIIINNINKNKDAKDTKDNNNTIHLSTRKSSNNLRINIHNQNKYGSIQTNRIFLKKHIVIESKNKNNVNDTGKNNNSINLSSNNNKNNNDVNNGNNNMNYNYKNNNNESGINCHNSINLKIKDRNNNFKDYEQISNYQNIFNKYKSKNLVLGEIFNNNDF